MKIGVCTLTSPKTPQKEQEMDSIEFSGVDWAFERLMASSSPRVQLGQGFLASSVCRRICPLPSIKSATFETASLRPLLTYQDLPESIFLHHPCA